MPNGAADRVSAGRMPRTSNGSPFRTMVRPTIDGSPPSRESQNRWPMTASFGWRSACASVGREAAAHRDGRVQHLEVVGGDDERGHGRRLFGPAPVDFGFDKVSGDARKRAALVERAPHRIRGVAAASRADVDELVGAVRRGPGEEQGVAEPEDREVDADAQGDRRRRGHGQHRLAAQDTAGVAEVLHEVGDRADAARLAALLLDARQRAELPGGGAASGGGLHAFATSSATRSSR